MNKYIIELNGKDKVWLAEVKLCPSAAYNLEQAGYVITLAEDVYDEETFDLMVEEDES